MIPLEAHVWLKQTGQFYLPPFNWAIIRLQQDPDGEYYLPYHIAWHYSGEVKFRSMQTYKYYERVRAIPTYAVVKVEFWPECTDYEVITQLSDKRSWKHKVSWHEVIRFITEDLLKKWPIKVAGFDGPFTPG